MPSEPVAILLAMMLGVLAIVPLGAHRPLAMAATTVARLVLSAWIFARYAAEGARRRMRGERGLGPELVRRAFEDLGPTYLKLAQLVASSSGLFPDRYCREFQKTLDRVKPFPFDEGKGIPGGGLGGDAAGRLRG